ncbi:prolyl-tRNA synthetase associated domain-containing protein [Romboutsia sp.]|uniref:prolyl-tRNA synthetase associated domain-containing protein n=1 Tax=Romboutsia sp. TaxID=1965302 RepID=UPI003F33110A
MKPIRSVLRESEVKIYNILEHLEVPFEVYEHEPVCSAEQLEILDSIAKGHNCKNLLLKNAKQEEYFLVVVKGDKKVDLQNLKDQIGSKKLSLASEIALYNTLKLRPGSVNPFSVINDLYRKVDILIDEELLDGQNLNFHPGINTKTVNVPLDGFEKFLDYVGYNFNSIIIV